MRPENDFAEHPIDRGPPRRRQFFVGRWLFMPDVEDDGGPHTDDPDPSFARHTADAPAPPDAWRGWIAQTQRRQILVHIHHWSFDPGTVEVFELFDSLHEARAKWGRDERFSTRQWDAAEERLRELVAYDESHLDI